MSADEYQWYIGYIKQELEKGFVIEHSHWVSEKTNTQWVHPSSEDIQIAEKEQALHCKVEGEWNLCDLQNIMETMENAKMYFFIILVWNNIRKTGTHLILNMWPFLTKLTPTPILRKFSSFPFFLWDNDEDEIHSLQIFKTLKIMQKIVISKLLTSEVKKKTTLGAPSSWSSASGSMLAHGLGENEREIHTPNPKLAWIWNVYSPHWEMVKVKIVIHIHTSATLLR